MRKCKYLGTVMGKFGDKEGEIRERAVQGKRVIGSFNRILKCKGVSLEVKRGSIVLQSCCMQLQHGHGMNCRGQVSRLWKGVI